MCPKLLRSSVARRDHEYSTHTPKRFKCDDCGKAFRHKRDFIRHGVLHSNRAVFKCQICNRTMLSQKTLDTHTTKCKPNYDCSICGIRLKFKRNIVDHTPCCGVIFPCGKTFISSTSAKLHTCRICPVGFLESYNDTRHANRNSQHGRI